MTYSWNTAKALAFSGGFVALSGAASLADGGDWQVQAGPMVVFSGGFDDVSLIEDAVDPARNLSSGDFGLTPSFGGAVTLTGEIGGRDVELRGFAAGFGSSTAVLDFGAPTLTRINTAIPFFLPATTDVTGKREVFFASAEANVSVARWDKGSVFAGLRGVMFDDMVDYGFTTVPLPTTMTQTVTNRMIGPQIGVTVPLVDRGDGFTLTGTGRLAALYNWSTADTVLDTGFVTVTAADTGAGWTALAEVGVDAQWEVAPDFTIGLGYNLTVLPGVGSATAALTGTDFFTNTIPTFSETMFAHGLRLNAVLRF